VGDLIGLFRRRMPISLPLLPSFMQLYFGWGLRLAWSFACHHYVMLGVIVFNPPAASILICANTKVRTKRASPFGLHVPIDCVRRVIAWPLIACNNYLRVTIDLTQSIVRA
jgi:hypothetical protein